MPLLFKFFLFVMLKFVISEHSNLFEDRLPLDYKISLNQVKMA